MSGWVLAGVLGLTLAGCRGAPRWGEWSRTPTTRQINAALGRPEMFIYFSRYEVYRDESGVYLYQANGSWVRRNQPPPGISVATLEASPSTKLQFAPKPGPATAAGKPAESAPLWATSP